MHPILIDFGWRDLPLIGRTHLYLGTYGVVFSSAALLAWLLWLKIARRDGFEGSKLLDLGFYALLAGILGSKVGLILTDPGYYLSSPAAFLSTVRAAGVLLFGVMAGIVTIVLYTRRHGMPLWAILDTMAPSLALGQAIGRLGCLAAGCCYGRRAVGLPWGIRFTDPVAAMLSGTPIYDPSDPEGALNVLHPVQIYQALADFGLFIILLLLARRRRFEGMSALAFIGLYSISRGLIEFFRGDLERGVYFLPGLPFGISTSQVISLAGLIFVGFAWPMLSRRPRRPAALPGASAASPSVSS